MAYQLVGAVLYDGSINPNNGEWQGHYTAVVACNAGRTKWQTISDNVVGQCGSISSRVNTHARVLLYSMAP